MDSNTHSTSGPAQLSALVAELQELAAQDPDRLSDGARAERVRGWRGLLDRQEGLWLGELAAVDARGAAGAEEGTQAGSTASWLRARLRMGAGAASSAVRTARALFGGPLTATAQALTDGEISPAHAQVLAHGTQELPDHLAAEAEPVLVEAARRLDPPRLRRVVAHLCGPPTPTARTLRPNDTSSVAGCRWPPPGRAWSRSMGCWRPRPARPSWLPWNPWPARPALTTPALGANAAPMPSPSWPAAT